MDTFQQGYPWSKQARTYVTNHTPALLLRTNAEVQSITWNNDGDTGFERWTHVDQGYGMISINNHAV